jgi:hypothetical protein
MVLTMPVGGMGGGVSGLEAEHFTLVWDAIFTGAENAVPAKAARTAPTAATRK